MDYGRRKAASHSPNAILAGRVDTCQQAEAGATPTVSKQHGAHGEAAAATTTVVAAATPAPMPMGAAPPAVAARRTAPPGISLQVTTHNNNIVNSVDHSRHRTTIVIV